MRKHEIATPKGNQYSLGVVGDPMLPIGEHGNYVPRLTTIRIIMKNNMYFLIGIYVVFRYETYYFIIMFV